MRRRPLGALPQLARRCVLLWGLLKTGSQAYHCDEKVQPIRSDAQDAIQALPGCTGYQREHDLQDIVLDLVEGFQESALGHRRRAEDTEWYSIYHEYFASRAARRQGLDEYEPATAIYVAEGWGRGQSGQQHQQSPVQLDAADAAVLTALLPVRRSAAQCSDPAIGCQMRNGRLRVTALGIPVGHGRGDWSSLLSNLTELQALTLPVVGTKGFDVEAATALRLAHLEVLEVPQRKDVVLPWVMPFFSALLPRLTTLRALIFSPEKYADFDFSLTSICSLKELRQLHLPDMNIHEVPACMGELKQLRVIYMPCNYLKAAPLAIADLPELRVFVAFRQGEYTPCHLREASGSGARSSLPRNLQDLGALRERHGDCKWVWETSMGLDGTDNPRVLCPWLSIRGPLDDWLRLRWPKLEKLWLDGNFISGSIPASVTAVFPRLRSLDLYDNMLSGQIPRALASAPWEKLQLMGNRLSGDLPPEILRTGCCYFTIGWNPNLTGCIPEDIRSAVEPDWDAGLPGTQVKACRDEGGRQEEL